MQLHLHMDRLTHTHMPKGGLTWVLCNQAPSLPVFSPLPTPICLLRLTWWAWCHFPFLSLKNRRTKTGLCACALMWAIAKCFYNDVMLLASCSSSSSPPSLRLFRSLRRGHTQMQTQAKESVHNKKKKANEWWQLDNHDVHFTDVHKKTHKTAWKQQDSGGLQEPHIVHLHTFAYRGTLESPIDQCFWSVGGNQEKTHAQFEKKTTIT